MKDRSDKMNLFACVIAFALAQGALAGQEVLRHWALELGKTLLPRLKDFRYEIDAKRVRYQAERRFGIIREP